MASHLVRKVSNAGIGYSVVELNDVRHVFATAVPRHGSTLREQAGDALRVIESAVREEGAGGAIIHQAVFVANSELIEPCRQIIREFYGQDLPATSYIPQSPCDGKLVAIEALGLDQGRGDVEIDRLGEQIVVARHNGIAWIHCAQVVPQTSGDRIYDDAVCAFRQMRSLFASAGVNFDRVIRTWHYLGGITDREGACQRYQEFNRARSDFFDGIPFLAGRLPPGNHGQVYPASTGIGANGHGIMLSAIALSTKRDDIVAAPLENPRQTAAYDYSAKYSPRSPKFSRAMALSCGTYATIFISGTASITASETRHLGDAAAQTDETLDNIAALISEENLGRHGMPGLGTSLESLGLLRVYIKRQEDYARVRAACEARVGEMPIIYALADVCRPELLVEIEGVAFSRKVED